VINLHNKTKKFWQFYSTYWFLIWVVIYGVLYYLLTKLSELFNISNNYFQIIFVGAIICLFARIISTAIHKKAFKLSFNLLIWTLIYIFLLFGMQYLLTYLSDNFLFSLILIALGFTIGIHLLKKISFETLSVIFIVLAIIFIALLFFSKNEQLNTLISNKTTLNKANNESNSELTIQKILEAERKNAISKCKTNVKEVYETQKIKSPIDFSYRVIETKILNSYKEANDYSKTYSTGNLYKLCTPRGVSSTQELTIIGVLIETRYDSAQISMMGIPIEKESSVSFCNFSGDLLDLKMWCD